MRYDCIIVGAGPAGIFAALELITAKRGSKVLILEKGKDLPERKLADLFQGWGGEDPIRGGKSHLLNGGGGGFRAYI